MTKEKTQSPVRSVWERFKAIEWTRERLEGLACLFIVLCALTVPFVSVKSQGSLTYDGGKITYQGQVQNNAMDGQGTLTYANGDRYKGNFSHGVFSGQGTYRSATGWKYVGHFTNGQADGQGTLTTEDGTVYKGTFEKGIYKK
ncbi:hypothetical protein [Streptococcus sp. DD12]|uniref:hypothetical protein n=1 Tax=Streptococcus sp. DD12 TaxID=1777880 RepID=UPI0007963CD4|nr:hypothetical protein [Streptococcus sp. DD12]KXT76049.1 MORN motif family protein [Streptococcus sp. DD12]